MIVYVESNFILELAYLQEDHESCERITNLAEQQRVVLVLPAFCLGEPYDSSVRRWKERQALHERFTQEIKELSRSQPYSALSTEAQEITRILIQSSEDERQRLNAVISRLVDTTTIVPIEGEVVRAALRLQSGRKLSPQDALVYASVLSRASAAGDAAKCFLTKNSKDFANPDIYQDLSAHNCKLLTKFRDGLGYIRSLLG